LYKTKARGPRGKPVIIVNSGLRLDETYSVTLMTTLSKPEQPYVIDLRSGSNSQVDFLKFVVYCIRQRYLTSGDYFIVDNAAVHGGYDTFETLFDLCETAGVKLIFLPKYSPELDPCELVFQTIKMFIRNNRTPRTFWLDVLQSLLTVTHAKMYSFYNHSIRISNETIGTVMNATNYIADMTHE